MRDTRLTRLLLSLALMTALALVAIDYQDGSSPIIRSARSVAGSVFGTGERVISAVAGPVGRLFDSGQSASANAQVQALRRQLIAMRAKLSAADLRHGQYRQLHRMLQVAGRGGYRVMAASVIGYGQGLQQTVTLDAGRADGIRPQQTVIDGDGLVGQVISVSAGTCTVLLLSDPRSVVGIRLAPGGQIGWVTGSGTGSSQGAALLKLQVLDPGALRSGEQLVTAASVRDRPFVPGVPVGVVVSVKNRAGALTGQAFVRPYASLASLDVLGIVIAPPAHNPRFAVLPPKPSPAPSPSPSPSRHGSARQPRHG